MDDKELLSSDQIALLRWLVENEPKTLSEMREADAPGYSDNRVEQMRKAGWLDARLRFGRIGGPTVAEYSVSDRSRAFLEKLAQDEAERAQREAKEQAAKAERQIERAQDRADAAARVRSQNKSTIVAAILQVTIPFILGIIAEHWFSIYEFVVSLFRN